MTRTFSIEDETSHLKTVIVGTATDRGELQMYNPTVAHHDRQGTLPNDQDLTEQVEGLCRTLKQYGVEVLRPDNVPGVLQTFVRDLGFVIGDTFFWSNLKREKRKKEQQGIRSVIDGLGITQKSIPKEISIEGGDVVLAKGKVFVGVGNRSDRRRTSKEAVDYLRGELTGRDIIEVIINASDDRDDDPKTHVLHLDCAFQPVGSEHAVLFEEGFVGPPEQIMDLIGNENLIRVSGQEMFQMYPNLFSISPETIISAPTFSSLNLKLRGLGINVLEVAYEEIAKLGGLFRCSTLPISRSTLPRTRPTQ